MGDSSFLRFWQTPFKEGGTVDRVGRPSMAEQAGLGQLKMETSHVDDQLTLMKATRVVCF